MTRTMLTLGLATCLLIAAPASPDDKPKAPSGAPADLIGGYTLVSGEKYGLKEPAERIEGVTVRFADDAIVVLDKDKKEAYISTYKVDATKTPWSIVMKSKVTPYTQKGADEQVARGLIQKDGDTVKLIYALPGGELPTEFKTQEKQIMFVMKNDRK